MSEHRYLNFFFKFYWFIFLLAREREVIFSSLKMRRWLLEHFKILIYTFCRRFLVFFGNIFSVFTLKDFDFNFYNFNKLRSFCLLFLFLFCTIFFTGKIYTRSLAKIFVQLLVVVVAVVFFYSSTLFSPPSFWWVPRLYFLFHFSTHTNSAQQQRQ